MLAKHSSCIHHKVSSKGPQSKCACNGPCTTVGDRTICCRCQARRTTNLDHHQRGCERWGNRCGKNYQSPPKITVAVDINACMFHLLPESELSLHAQSGFLICHSPTSMKASREGRGTAGRLENHHHGHCPQAGHPRAQSLPPVVKGATSPEKDACSTCPGLPARWLAGKEPSFHHQESCCLCQCVWSFLS